MALVIIGHHRSGTSLLVGLCTKHPDITLTNEFGNFMVLDQPYAEYARFIIKRWWKKRNARFVVPLSIGLGQKIKGVNMLQNLLFVTRYLLKVYNHREGRITVPTIEAALKDIFPRSCIVGDKYPDYWFRLDQLAKIDSLDCLFIYRDPRDLANSVVEKSRTVWRKSWPEGLRDVRNVAKRWVHLIELMERNIDKIHTIRYEELVTNPRPILQDLGDWLGIDPSGFQHEAIRSTSVGKYKSGLSESEITAIIEIAGHTMQQVGYKI